MIIGAFEKLHIYITIYREEAMLEGGEGMGGGEGPDTIVPIMDVK